MIDIDDMKKLAGSGKASRREFIQFALATGISVAAAETMFGEAVAATPKQGGSARFGLAHGATTDTLDPAGYPDTGTQVPFWGAMSNSLTEVDAKGNITADLLESMEPADGAKTWVFKLLKGVTFHNGKSFTADDVIASYRYHMGPNSKSAAKSLLQAVTDIKADGRTRSSSRSAAAMPTSPISAATTTSRSCRRRRMGRRIGSRATAPAPSSSNPGSPACRPS